MRFPKLILPTSSVDEAPLESICINREWIPIVLSVIERLEFATAWAADTDMDAVKVQIHTLAYLLVNALEGCGLQESCQTFYPTHDRFTWYPESPYEPGEEVPDGYPFHPWTVVDEGIISSIIAEFGLGYQVGDVFTDLLHFPTFTGWDDLFEDYLNFPHFRINDLVGTGTVKVHLLNIPFGGKALIVVDDVVHILNPFENQIVELNKEISVPPETQVPIVIEVKIDTPGEHHIDVVFLPTVNPSLVFLSFGGGVRAIEICGFGMEGCPDMSDPCCPDEIDLLRQILETMKGGFTIMPRAGTEPSDTIVDCSPPGFDFGSDDDDVIEQIRRFNALCLTVERYVSKLILQMVLRLNMPSSYLSMALAIPGVAYDNSFMYRATWRYPTTITIATVKSWFEATEYKELICIMFSYLQGKENTFAAFQLALEGIDTSSYSDSMKLLIAYAHSNNGSLSVYQEFARELDNSYDVIGDTPGYSCSCFDSAVCDPADFNIIPVNDCTVERLTDTTWRITQTNYTDAPPDKRAYTAIFRDAGYRCFNHTTSSQAQAGWQKWDCAGVYSEGVGGGGGEEVQEGIIVLEYDTDPEVGIDTIVTIICP